MLPDVPLVTMAETPSLVGHVHLTVRELDRSGAFYRERRHGAGTGWAVAGTADAVDAGGVDVAVAGVFRRAGARVCGVLVTAATSPSSPRSAAAPSPSNSSGPPTASRRPLVNPRSSHTVGQQYVNKRWSSRAKNRGQTGFPGTVACENSLRQYEQYPLIRTAASQFGIDRPKAGGHTSTQSQQSV
jgi:hypothetical protein